MATGLADRPTSATSPEPPARRWTRWRGSTVVIALAGALAGAVLFLFAYRGMPDDTYITLDYARNLVEHGHWGLTRFRDANTATAPLNIWLLAGGILVTGRPVVAVGIVLVLTTAALAVWAAALAEQLGLRRPVVAGLVVGLIVTSPIFASVVGMESFLVAATLVGVARYAVARRPVAAGVVTGLAVLTRPDLALPAVALLAVLFVARRPRQPRRLLQALAVGVAVALPWHIWSWFVLGSFVPDSLIIKTGGSFPGGEVFGNGPAFFAGRWPVPMLLIGAVVVTGLVALGVAAVRWGSGRARPVDRAVVACGLAALLHYGAYSVMGVSSYIWYYCPSLALITLCAALGAADLAARRVGAVVTALVVVAGISTGLQVAPGVPWAYPLLYGNWATSGRYLVIGEELGRTLPPGESVLAPPEIGALAYGCGCDIVDPFSDRARLMFLVAEREATAGPVERFVLRLNFTHADRSPVEPTDHVLRYTKGTGPGWQADVPWRGPARLVLDPPGADPYAVTASVDEG